VRFTVVLNTFNRAHFLPRALTAWTRFPADQVSVVVADDGSEDDTDEVIREWGARLPYPLVHVKHARQGHRRAEILNKAVEHARDEALLFTDADSLPAADLLDVHTRDFRSDRFLVGGYVLMGEAFTAALDLDGVMRGDYESQLTPRLQRALTRRQWKNRFYILLRSKGRPHIMGLNMVIPRSGFVAVNGFDNEFRGWGRADGDLRERLKQVGVRPFSNWNEALIFHMHHAPDPTKSLRANVAYSERAEIPTVALNGFEQCRQAARDSLVYRNRV